MNFCVCLYWPCSCEAQEPPRCERPRRGPGLRKAVVRDGEGDAGAERRRAVRMLAPPLGK